LVKFDISNTKCPDVSLYTLNDICNYPYSIYSTNTYAAEIDLSNSNVNRLDTSAFVFKLDTDSAYSKKVKLNWRN
jgi:DNA-binding Xre family transcriptional regulator